MSLKESAAAQRNMETQLISTCSTDSSKDFRIKDLEGSKRALEQENELLRKKVGENAASLRRSKHRARKISILLYLILLKPADDLFIFYQQQMVCLS